MPKIITFAIHDSIRDSVITAKMLLEHMINPMTPTMITFTINDLIRDSMIRVKMLLDVSSLQIKKTQKINTVKT